MKCKNCGHEIRYNYSDDKGETMLFERINPNKVKK